MQTDYFVKGCGASAMAFVDVMLRETEAKFIIVDNRAAPGGHWNDAYPFVRLHQPAASYGVPSRELGRMRKDVTGFNRGLYELASGVEVADYFHQVMRDSFLPTGRVTYYPVCEVVGKEGGGVAEFASLLSGEHQRVEVKKKFVDATMLNTSIPLTHERKFSVAAGVLCVPPNDLTRVGVKYTHFTVLGAGKTAIDSLLWLLGNGAKPETLSWVVPRDPWLLNRAYFQPGPEFFSQTVGAVARQFEVAAAALSVREFCQTMESEQIWLRLDTSVWPTMFHGATVTLDELDQLRRVGRIIRNQRVRRIEPGHIITDCGLIESRLDELFVDCTAQGIAIDTLSRWPVFAPDIIRLQVIRQGQPTFSAAMIGHIEASISDEREKQTLTQVTPMTDTVTDWAAMMAVSMSNQENWNRSRELNDWIANCRLCPYSGQARRVRKDDAAMRAILSRMYANAGLAVEAFRRLSQEAP